MRADERFGFNPDTWSEHERPLVAVTFADLVMLDLPPRENVLAPWLPRQGLAMIYAPRGIGKTFFGLNVAYAVASGGEFLKWQAPTPRRTLYIDGEMPATTVRERVQAMVLGSLKEPPAPDFIRLITPDLQGWPMPNLTTEEGQARVEPWLAGVELVVVDNLATLCRHAREGEGTVESWLPVQEWALGLRRRGISALFVHHAGKGGQQRGTSAREDVLDTVISLRRPEDYTAAEGARFEVHFEKARGLAGDGAAAFEAMLEVNDDRAVWTVRDLENRDVLLVARLTGEGMSVREIVKETGIPRSTVSRHQLKAKEMGLLK